jgi:hypothetical protein
MYSFMRVLALCVTVLYKGGKKFMGVRLDSTASGQGSLAVFSNTALPYKPAKTS